MGMMTFRPGQRLVIPGVQVLTPRLSSAAFTGVLDGISNVAAAYSLRKLLSAYAGSAVRVRRSSDSTEQDVGFASDGEFDSSAFSSFVGGGTGYVKTWYDQSGNGRDVTQATTGNQPSIALSVVNSKSIIRFNGTSSTLVASSAFIVSSANAMIITLASFDYPGIDSDNYLAGNDSGSTALFGYDDDSSGMRILSGAGGYFGGNKRGDVGNTPTIFSIQSTSSSNRMYNNGAQQGSAINAITLANFQRIGSYVVGRFFDGDMAEFIAITASVTTDHNTIGTDMATRYGLSWTTVT